MAENSENINGFLKSKVKFMILRGVEKGVTIEEHRCSSSRRVVPASVRLKKEERAENV